MKKAKMFFIPPSLRNEYLLKNITHVAGTNSFVGIPYFSIECSTLASDSTDKV